VSYYTVVVVIEAKAEHTGCCVYTILCSAIGSLVYSYIKYAEQQEERSKKLLKLNGDMRVTEEGKESRDSQPILPPAIK